MKRIQALPVSMAITSTASRRVLETKEEAAKAVSSVLKNTEKQFELVDFDKYNRTARLRSKHYQQYFVLSYHDTTKSADWLVYHYFMNQRCDVEKSVFSFRNIECGTN